ncbi:MAG: molybdopterin cofactor-binding domain-containing protein, partial [Desulfurococcaceae archaeon]
NRTGAEFHAVGGFIQGMGYALMEEIVHSPEGFIYNNNLSKYHIPTLMDIPERINIDFVEEGFSRGPFGAKGLGEPSIVAVAPSIVNAVAHALKSRIANRDLNVIPLTPDRLYSVIKKHSLNK